ncbi:MAG: HAMP domain-containing protein [Nitrospirae bacterium]|nr:HAMP domain-containing protein [Nitrospirota bacterium]
MRRRLIYSLAMLFLLFSLGASIAMVYTYRITHDLESVITLHRIEIIRQNFVINIQTVQSNLFATGTIFGKELDTIVENVSAMDTSVKGCLGCHHDKEMTDRLIKVNDMVEQYKEAISYLVTSTANEQRIERLKMVAVSIGDSLLMRTQEMATIADNVLRGRTIEAVKAINQSRIILIITLLGSLVLALGIAVTLTKKITRPVNELVNAARMIASGNLGYKTQYHDDSEFGEVADSFNAMSTALEKEQEKTHRYIDQLSGLYKVTLNFYDIVEMDQAFQETCRSIADILKVKQVILFLYDDARKAFVPNAMAHVMPEGYGATMHYSLEKMAELYQISGGLPGVVNEGMDANNYDPLVPLSGMETNLMAAWLLTKEKILGILRVSDKEGGFVEEDAKILIILANHMAVAMENRELYRDLEAKMEELRQTQEQLIQSAKLAAIGELASNVAHEINNPLTSIIGFTELSKEEDDVGMIRKSLEIIEKESLRARDIVKQLLGFARKKPLQLTEVMINDVLRDVVVLSSSQARMARVKISEDYGNVPLTTGDVDQLKQVFLNVITNAVHAMPDGGNLTIKTSMQSEYILLRITDTGHGIPEDVKKRIFEPFFSTKKDKGTGLGLSISYRIIQDHGGRIDVESEEGKGTTFIIRLPVKVPVETV